MVGKRKSMGGEGEEYCAVIKIPLNSLEPLPR